MLVFTLSDELYDDVLGQKSDSPESFCQYLYLYMYCEWGLSRSSTESITQHSPNIIYYDLIFQYLGIVTKFQIFTD